MCNVARSVCKRKHYQDLNPSPKPVEGFSVTGGKMKRPHTRAFEKHKQEFFEQGKALDAAGDQRADCWICHKRIDYSVPAGSTPTSHELDHYYVFSKYPELFDDPANFRHAHRQCNRERGDGQPKADLGDVIAQWW